MKVIYTGKADFQEFSAEDFKKGGVEDQRKVSFPNGVPIEVSEAAGKALTSDEGLFAQDSFKVHEEDEPTPAVDEGGQDDQGVSGLDQAELADEGLEATNEGSAPAVKSTGRGSSTRGKA